MVKLRFIKAWGPHKVGDVMETGSRTTVRWLVDVYQFAVIEPFDPEPEVPKRIEIDPVPKFIRKPQRDKMVYGASNKFNKR